MMSTRSEALLDHIANYIYIPFISNTHLFWFSFNESYNHDCHLVLLPSRHHRPCCRRQHPQICKWQQTISTGRGTIVHTAACGVLAQARYPCTSKLRLMMSRRLVIVAQSGVDRRDQHQGNIVRTVVVNILTWANGNKWLTVSNPRPPPQEAHGQDRHTTTSRRDERTSMWHNIIGKQMWREDKRAAQYQYNRAPEVREGDPRQ